MNRRIAIIGGGSLTSALTTAIAHTGAGVVIIHDRQPKQDHTQTLAEIPGDYTANFVEPEPVNLAPALSRRERRGDKSESFYARRDQIARKGGKR
jgi:ketopantoate reductase